MGKWMNIWNMKNGYKEKETKTYNRANLGWDTLPLETQVMRNSQPWEYGGEGVQQEFSSCGNRVKKQLWSQKKPVVFEKQIQGQWHWSLMNGIQGRRRGDQQKASTRPHRSSWLWLGVFDFIGHVVHSNF